MSTVRHGRNSLKTAAKHKVAMELNAYPDRLDLNDVHLRHGEAAWCEDRH